MSFRFKPEMFEGTYGHFQKELHEKYCEIANRLLDEYVKTLPEVVTESSSVVLGEWVVNGDRRYSALGRWRARLWDIQEIAPKKCEHVSIEKYESTRPGRQDFVGYAGVCHKCGVKLKPIGWEEAP